MIFCKDRGWIIGMVITALLTALPGLLLAARVRRTSTNKDITGNLVMSLLLFEPTKGISLRMQEKPCGRRIQLL
ncbi:hypothetical protein KZ483_25515 [Paenibacillus sp. sptzw28]|uniref:hypothetical protein n=1 Tax=Paenibacillus sp. sptzw28 TaxID=715179 RepID=UPI001C6EBB63|nr:hypothetical protein [Paenibacillus sp. sptzw28]QYR21047.1 hypothetical protein KZ483_25515 [Paenibacillus sp. sptzw28]